MVAVSGDLDIGSSAEFSAQLDAATAAASVCVIVDFSGVQFVDSSGLNALVVGARETEHRGGSLIVAAPSQYIARVFDLVRIGELLDIVETVDEAIASTSSEREDE